MKDKSNEGLKDEELKDEGWKEWRIEGRRITEFFKIYIFIISVSKLF